MAYTRSQILVCGGTGCHSSGSDELINLMNSELQKHNIENEVDVVQTGCFGLCALGPVVIVYPEGTFYSRVEASDIGELIEEHLVKGRPLNRLVYHETTDDETVTTIEELAFFKTQERIALHNCGVIDPARIDEYLAFDGYKALEKVLLKMEPQEVIDLIKDSEIRGRGGAGFPSGLKWQFTKDAPGDEKVVACNADEGDPGAFMDRSVLEGDPHVLIEAMAIAGYAIGANVGYVYVRAEYPIAVNRLSAAIEHAKEYGLLGKNILNSGFDFDLEIRLGSGAFVCGEETALLNSIEGKRGEPRPRPPFPAIKGLFEKPTLLNNVETYANIPAIIRNGADWYKQIGTEGSRGTKVFALGGKINNTGLLEIPMGTTMREIVFNIGGGVPDGKKYKATQIGGPSGACVPDEHLDTPIDYDSLKEIGAMMGSGGLIVMDEDNCMVDVARFFLEFTCDESCGKCPPCRIGTKRMLEILEDICKGKGKEGDIERLEELAQGIRSSSLCGLGQTAPNPVLSTIRFFRDEYEAHIRDKSCPAGACKELVRFRVVEDNCKACGICKKKCPTDAIEGEKKVVHFIDQDKCIKCGVCMEVCPFDAIEKK